MCFLTIYLGQSWSGFCIYVLVILQINYITYIFYNMLGSKLIELPPVSTNIYLFCHFLSFITMYVRWSHDTMVCPYTRWLTVVHDLPAHGGPWFGLWLSGSCERRSLTCTLYDFWTLAQEGLRHVLMVSTIIYSWVHNAGFNGSGFLLAYVYAIHGWFLFTIMWASSARSLLAYIYDTYDWLSYP